MRESVERSLTLQTENGSYHVYTSSVDQATSLYPYFLLFLFHSVAVAQLLSTAIINSIKREIGFDEVLCE